MPPTEIFPEPIRCLPRADIPLEGLSAFLSQADTHQIIFTQFSQDVELPEHAHEAQWGVVLAGEIELSIAGVTRRYSQGERYFIPSGVEHSGKVFAGYADITFFDQPDCYAVKAE